MRVRAWAAYHYDGDQLKEFDGFESAFAYEESCRINGQHRIAGALTFFKPLGQLIVINWIAGNSCTSSHGRFREVPNIGRAK